jgi:hypothetical protein
MIATTKRDTPVQVIRVALGVGSAALLIKTGMDYLQAIDDQLPKTEKPTVSIRP